MTNSELKNWQNRAAKALDTLDRDQRHAADRIITVVKNGTIPNDFWDGVFSLIGEGGTGKSLTINVVYNYLKAYGYNVVVLAPTNAAARNLSSTNAATIHSYLEMEEVSSIADDTPVFKRKVNTMNSSDLVFIDESSMVGQSTLDIIKSGIDSTLIVFCGDSFQLNPIKETKVDYVMLAKETFELKTNHRQNNNFLKPLVDAARLNSGITASTLDYTPFLNQHVQVVTKNQALIIHEALSNSSKIKERYLAYENKDVDNYAKKLSNPEEKYMLQDGLQWKIRDPKYPYPIRNSLAINGDELIFNEIPIEQTLPLFHAFESTYGVSWGGVTSSSRALQSFYNDAGVKIKAFLVSSYYYDKHGNQKITPLTFDYQDTALRVPYVLAVTKKKHKLKLNNLFMKKRDQFFEDLSNVWDVSVCDFKAELKEKKKLDAVVVLASSRTNVKNFVNKKSLEAGGNYKSRLDNLTKIQGYYMSAVFIRPLTAMTVNKSQGQSLDAVFLDAKLFNRSRELYVALSRAKNDIYIIV